MGGLRSNDTGERGVGRMGLGGRGGVAGEWRVERAVREHGRGGGEGVEEGDQVEAGDQAGYGVPVRCM